MSIENMTETFVITEARGKENLIKSIKFFIKFELNGKYTLHGNQFVLNPFVSADTSIEDLINLCKSQYTEEALNEIRNYAYETLLEKEFFDDNNELYINNKIIDIPISIPRLYIRLAIIEHDSNLWDQIETYFNSTERTEVEKTYFKEAVFWRKDDPIIQNTLNVFNISEEMFNSIFRRAAELEQIVQDRS